jgi:hypothetical protein
LGLGLVFLVKVNLIGFFCQLCIRVELKNPMIKKIYHLNANVCVLYFVIVTWSNHAFG